MSEKKQYTYINLAHSVNQSNGAMYVSGTVIGVLTNPETKTAGEHTVVRASLPINNRTKTINKFFDASFNEDTETLWANVNFWDARADRFNSMLAAYDNPKNLFVVISGTFAVQEYTKKDGTTGKSLTINAIDWYLIRAGKKDSAGTPAQTQQNTTSSASTMPVPPAPTPGFDEDGFIQLPDIDNDLPF